MKYIGIGFCLAFGWTWGKAFAGVLAKKILDKTYEGFDQYQENTPAGFKSEEDRDDTNMVKNRIGFI